ncbi:hypothetical protein D3C81_1009760 [compost metagenome]
MVKKLIFYFDQVVLIPVFTGHHSSEHICICHVQSTISIPNLHYVFLIYHNPIGFFKLFFKHWVWIDHLIRIMVPFDKFSHHTR